LIWVQPARRTSHTDEDGITARRASRTSAAMPGQSSPQKTDSEATPRRPTLM
jgi:hypothetical protein